MPTVAMNTPRSPPEDGSNRHNRTNVGRNVKASAIPICVRLFQRFRMGVEQHNPCRDCENCCMATRLLVKLEFGRTNAEQRSIFWTEMRRRGWVPYVGKPNVVCTEIRGTTPDAEILDFAEAELRHAATMAQIQKWNCVCLLEDVDAPTQEWNEAV